MLPKEGYKKIAVILFYLVVGLLFAYLFFKYLFSALLPFLIAYVIAFALQGVIAFLHNRLHFPKKLASLLLVTLTSGLFFLLIYLIVARVYEELSALTVSVRNFIDSLRNDPDFARTWINRINDAFPFFDIEKPLTEFWLNIDARLEQLLSVLAEKLSGAVIPLLGGILTVVPNAFLGIFIVIISSYYMATDFARINRFLLSLFPQKLRSDLKNAYGDAKQTVFKLLKAYSLIIVITFAQLFIGFLLLDVKYAFLIALLTAFVDILPVLGTGTVLVPWSVWLFAVGDYPRAVGLLVLYAIITVLRQILEPKIVGKYIGLYPLATLFSMYVGLKLMGVLGLLLFPLGVMVGKSVLDRRSAEKDARPPESQ